MVAVELNRVTRRGEVRAVTFSQVATEEVAAVVERESNVVLLDVVVDKAVGVTIAAHPHAVARTSGKTTDAATVHLTCIDKTLRRTAALCTPPHRVAVVGELAVHEGVVHGEVFDETQLNCGQQRTDTIHTVVRAVERDAVRRHVVDPVGVEQAGHCRVAAKATRNVSGADHNIPNGKPLYLGVVREVIDLDHGLGDRTTATRKGRVRRNNGATLACPGYGHVVVANKDRVADQVGTSGEEHGTATGSTHHVDCVLDGRGIHGNAVAHSTEVFDGHPLAMFSLRGTGRGPSATLRVANQRRAVAVVEAGEPNLLSV